MQQLNIRRAAKLMGLVLLLSLSVILLAVSLVGKPEVTNAAPATQVAVQATAVDAVIEEASVRWSLDVSLPGRPDIDAHAPRYDACRTYNIGGVDPTDGILCEGETITAAVVADTGRPDAPVTNIVINPEPTQPPAPTPTPVDPPATVIVTDPPPTQVQPTPTPQPVDPEPVQPEPTECKNKNSGKDGTPYECNAGIGQEKRD